MLVEQDYVENKRILMKLVTAQNEEEVNEILKDSFFDNVKWKPYGGDHGNFGTIINQQTKAVDALCEKPINSIDAILIKECLKRGINPEDQANAPQTMKEATEQFLQVPEGDVTKLSDEQRRELAKLIRIVADGGEESNIIIADRGEGQHPDNFEDTLLSLNRTNKIKIKFVQGKFNMGGTGVLRFCGQRNYELILSRRSVELDKNSEWGFTLVRVAQQIPDSYRLPWFEYVADKNEKIFRFHGESLPIFPWGEEFLDGCFIKLYNYNLPSTTDVTQRGLWGPLSRKLYSPMLPFYVYEMRHNLYQKIKGKNDRRLLSGSRYRILKNKDQIHKRITIPCSIKDIGDIKIEVTIFEHATKNKKRINITDDYTNNYPLFLTMNGQSHYEMEKSKLRTNIGMPSLADYMMVHIDLSRHDKIFLKIFMGSRDRIVTDSKLSKLLIKRIFEDLKDHPTIQDLEEDYKRLNNESLTKDATIMNLIKSAVRETPSLWKLFGTGDLITQPEAPKVLKTPLPFKGNPIPTFLKVKSNKIIIGDYEKKVPNDGTPTYIYFVTDVENGYDVSEDGIERLHVKVPSGITYTNFGLRNGQIPLKLIAPPNAMVGDIHDEKLILSLDRPNGKPLECHIILKYYKPTQGEKGHKRSSRKYPGINPPELKKIYRKDWGNTWNEELVAKVYLPDYIQINVDCKYLQDFLEIKTSSEHKKILQKYLLSIYFMAIYHHNQWKSEDNFEDGFNRSLRATAEGILPTINLMKEKELLKSITVDAIKSARRLTR